MSHMMLSPERGFGLLEDEEDQAQKFPTYMSKHRPAVVQEAKSNKDAMKTLGPAQVTPPCPVHFLKKHSKEPQLPDRGYRSREGHRCCNMKKPPVPDKNYPPPMGFWTTRNFVNSVIIEPRTVPDTHQQVLENAGLRPKYIKKEHYGTAPAYLLHRKEEVQRVRKQYDEVLREQKLRDGMKYLSEEERQATLQDLKKNLALLQSEHQTLSFIEHTASKRYRRQHLEEKMSQLEKKIELLQTFKYIYLQY